MTEQAPEERPDGESWDQLASRVQAEVVNAAYAESLANSFRSYLGAGFSHDQGFQLTLEEHRARLDLMNQLTLMNQENGTAEGA